MKCATLVQQCVMVTILPNGFVHAYSLVDPEGGMPGARPPPKGQDSFV